jgi:uncharacterized protein (TIGR03382 family)
MIRPSLLLATAAAVFMAAFPVDARACSLIGSQTHTIDPAMQATDQVPPTLPALPAARVRRGQPQESGCGLAVSSCDDLGVITIAVGATDDMSPRQSIGYRLTLESGLLPPGLSLPSEAIEAIPPSDQLVLYWSDAANDLNPFGFTLRIVAIDLAGNESEPQLLQISDDSGSGCAIARGPHPRDGWPAAAALAVAALSVVVRRRRARPQRGG